jgi:8-oxo-dGTP pyrophosphatase MutT (NUDIX family)
MLETFKRHPIQLFILERLRVAAGGLRYTDMRPPDTENDLYNYHLQHLVARSLVAKETDGYRLSPSGLRYIVELNPVSQIGESHRFKLASLCLVERGEGDQLQLLYQRRVRRPDAGEQGIIGGGIMRGELATDAAIRRLKEEAGLQGSFTLLGMLRKRRFDQAGDLYSDILFHVCICQDSRGRLERSNVYGTQAWIPLPQALNIENHGAVGSPKLAKILGHLPLMSSRAIPMFYLEEDYQMELS